MIFEGANISVHWGEFLALAIAHMVAVASPGPDFAMVTKHTITYGREIGRITALGISIAILLHVAYALLGFSLLVQSSPLLFSIIQWIGAIYLIYLAVMILISKPKFTKGKHSNRHDSMSGMRAFRIGFLTNALNIKAMLFFLFLFTSLIQPNTTMLTKIIYGGWLSFYTFIWFYFIASVFSWQPVRHFFDQFGEWFNKAMAILLFVFAYLIITNSSYI